MNDAGTPTKIDTKIYGKVAPDRLSVEPSSPYFNAASLKRIGVKFNGVVQNRLVEYCVSEGWVRRHVSSKGTRKGKPKLPVSANGRVPAFKSFGVVEVFVQTDRT